VGHDHDLVLVLVENAARVRRPYEFAADAMLGEDPEVTVDTL